MQRLSGRRVAIGLSLWWLSAGAGHDFNVFKGYADKLKHSLPIPRRHFWLLSLRADDGYHAEAGAIAQPKRMRQPVPYVDEHSYPYRPEHTKLEAALGADSSAHWGMQTGRKTIGCAMTGDQAGSEGILKQSRESRAGGKP